MPDNIELALRSLNYNVEGGLEEFGRSRELEDRRLYLNGVIEPVDCEEKCLYMSASMTSKLVENILDINRVDRGIEPEKREPIRLYINSPGGDLVEGTALLSAIKLSKTPVYTINMGQWCSMSFLIGIAGHKRFSLPNATFLMHDGTSGAFGSTSKVQDRIEFEKRFEAEVIKKHVLSHSNMKAVDYDALARVELYMLPEDALERGFIDEIVADIDNIL
ncbi:MAG: ATP-dependent Clp protease proteolytic subunit [Candidatus Saccharibacteria bacterium]|nr:ATP-dependent Clp protease proteolytic subunit [Candidatus Saccharibacteria bacterium]